MLVVGSLALTILAWIAIVLVAVIGYLMLIRLVRRIRPFPVPSFIARFIDNPLRRRIQPPSQVVDWLEIMSGMHVLEVGPGPGTSTLEVARRIGGDGEFYSVDIEPELITRLQRRLEKAGVTSVSVEVANAYELPFHDAKFDRVFMVTVLGEIPDKHRALSEFRRVLKSDGLLCIGEFLPDPDYVSRKRLTQLCHDSGFSLHASHGTWLHYMALYSY